MNEKVNIAGVFIRFENIFHTVCKTETEWHNDYFSCFNNMWSKAAYEKHEHFYRTDFLIRSVCFNSAAVTFVSPKIKPSVPERGKWKHSTVLAFIRQFSNSCRFTCSWFRLDFKIFLYAKHSKNYISLVLSNVLILLGIKAKKLCFQKLAATK